MPEIQQSDEVRARHLVPAATTMAMVPVVESRRKELAAAFAAHREAAVAAHIATATPPEPRALTAGFVVKLLPPTWFLGENANGIYKGKFGTIDWYERGRAFRFEINGNEAHTSQFTEQSFAALVAALGISVGVKHG